MFTAVVDNSLFSLLSSAGSILAHQYVVQAFEAERSFLVGKRYEPAAAASSCEKEHVLL